MSEIRNRGGDLCFIRFAWQSTEKRKEYVRDMVLNTEN